MSMVDSRRIASAPERQRRTIRPRVYAWVIASVFVAAVVTMAVKEGASGAVVTILLALALAGIAVGVWGTAMAVRETQDFGRRSDD